MNQKYVKINNENLNYLLISRVKGDEFEEVCFISRVEKNKEVEFTYSGQANVNLKKNNFLMRDLNEDNSSCLILEIKELHNKIKEMINNGEIIENYHNEIKTIRGVEKITTTISKK